MSALGHKQTFCDAEAMSALPPIADMCSALADVCYGPIADIGSLFDHLVSGRKKRVRNSQAELFRGLEING
jgi:hypothetical protein